jgi:hypothetical protein
MPFNCPCWFFSLGAALLIFPGFGGDQRPVVNADEARSQQTETTETQDTITAAPPPLVAEMMSPFHRDVDVMAEVCVVRALVTHSTTTFFPDGGTLRGVTTDAPREFERCHENKLRLGRP